MLKRPTLFRQLFACGWLLAALATSAASDAATLRAVANNNFVSATAAGTSFLNATAAVASTWEQFEIINNSNGTISLRATISGNFVSADIGLAAPNTDRLISNRQVASTWEQFTVVPQSNGTVALQAAANNLFVSADLNLGGDLIANRTVAQAWEQFIIDNGGGGGGTTPDFGPNVHIFTPSTPNLQGQINDIYNAQQPNQFGPRRDAILFMPGTYDNLSVPIGFYTEVLGLGIQPDQVLINGDLRSNALLSGDNATQNFWRGAENLSVNPTLNGGVVQWAVSQADPFRRIHVLGNMKLNQNNGFASGGWFSDVLVDGQVNSASQQQWISRNTQWGSWIGSNWNMVFVGVSNPPGGNFPSPRYTTVAQTPVVREKPYLFVDSAGNFNVRVPSLRTNSVGITWANGATTPGTTLPISSFFIAQPSDSAETINAQLAAGQNILFTPGIYVFDQTIQVNNPNTVLLGLGIATLRTDNGAPIMSTADVGGITIAGILFDAGASNSPVLLQVGPDGSSADHTANPTLLSDVFFRVGGAAAAQVSTNLSINANNTIVDDTWIWRADHGNGVGWNTNPSTNGLVVNGNNVTIYGLFVEHNQQWQTLWNGNGGRVYFYQSEIPYDPPSQGSWDSPTGRGWASYKVSDNVTTHEAWGLGVYSFFLNPNIFVDRAIEAPNNPNVRFHSMITVCLGSNGGIANVVNNVGGQTGCNVSFTPTVTSYP